MKKNLRLWSLLAIAAATVACSSPEMKDHAYNKGINIIPVPVELTQTEGIFTLTGKTVISQGSAEFASVADFLAEKIKTSTGYNLKKVDSAPETGYIRFVQDATVADEEGYELVSTPDGVTITASTAAGAFYGMQSLLQLLPAEIESPKKINDVAWNIPAVSIKDQPRFKYRGFHFDPTRHFSGVEFIKKQLDVLAMFKINKMHWHLTDDQLWVLEIKKYPELKEGSSRVEGDGKTVWSGWYTQEDAKEIVRYAAERHIEVIPEIEMPGHALAALVSHPELSCTGGPFAQPRIIWGVEDDVFCAGKEATFEFLENVLREVAEIFPSKYIHVGGDESPKVRWEKCPDCQRRIDGLGLRELAKKPDAQGLMHSPEEYLQSYFVTRMEKFANSLGKSIIGWDEILEGGLAPSATVMSWRGEEGGIAAATQDHYVIMTPQTEGYYLDHYQGAPEVEAVTIGGYATLEKIYSYNPIPAELPEDKHKYIWGPQGNTWSEYILTDEHREYMMYPRIVAIAEVAWSPLDRKDWDSFQTRLVNGMVRMDYHGINYHIPVPEGTLVDVLAFTGDQVSVPFTNTRNYDMVYTLDGTEPTAESSMYTAPLVISTTTTIKIATRAPHGKLSRSREILVDKQEFKPATEVATVPGINLRIADGLYVTNDEIAAAPFRDTVVTYFTNRGGGPRFDMNKPSVAIYEGYFEVPADDVYGFATDSYQLWIDGELVIENGQEMASRHLNKKTTRALAAGKHSYKMVFNNMIQQGWPNTWSHVTFWMQNLPITEGELSELSARSRSGRGREMRQPSKEEYRRVPVQILSRAQ